MLFQPVPVRWSCSIVALLDIASPWLLGNELRNGQLRQSWPILEHARHILGLAGATTASPWRPSLLLPCAHEPLDLTITGSLIMLGLSRWLEDVT